MNTAQSALPLSARARALEASKIREVAEAGMKLSDVVPLWFGEGAWPTDDRIVEAAVNALRAGNHMYQPNNGNPALRQQICDYSADLLGAALRPEQITVTPSGMQGLMLAAQVLVTPGDRVVAITPGWPNIVGAFAAMGAEIATLPLTVAQGRWTLDMERLLAALTPQTRVFVVNTPNTPTGWAMGAEDQKTVLEHCRKHGIWVVADDVYARLYRHGRTAPSFLSLAAPEERLLSINSFSKCWSMTGWRLGWVVAPAALEAKLGQLTEFNTSCTAGFIQEAGIVALRDCEDEVTRLTGKIQRGYNIAAAHLGRFSRVEFIEPDGAFYLFFKVDGMEDSRQAAFDILHQTKVGLAPGVAFGPEGEGHLRLCYAQPEAVLQQAFERLAPALSA
jgi:aspartate/methionine/tyrosine aminotransferase